MKKRNNTNHGGGFRWEYRDCIVCGKKFIAKNYNSVRCFECQDKHKTQTEKEKYWKRKAEKEKGKDKLNICEKIDTCKYGIRVGGIDICDYLAQEKKRRPCPAGACTVFERKSRKAVRCEI